MVVTSNYAPHGLLPDAELKTSASTWEEPFVKVSHEKSGHRTHHADFHGGRARQRSGLPSPKHSRQARLPLGTYTVRAIGTGRLDGSRAAVEVQGRTLVARAVLQDHIVFDFADLCKSPVGAGDVAALTDRFRVWTIENVPKLSLCSFEAAQRFVNFVDVLCDADVRLDITARVSPEDLFDASEPPPDLVRLQSRMNLLRIIESG